MAQFQKAADVLQYSSLLAPLISMGVNVIAQVLMVRARQGGKFLRSIIEGFGIGLIALIAMESMPRGESGFATGGTALLFLVNIPMYGCLSYCYFGLANLGQSSIRIRIYAELASNSKGVSCIELLQRYDEDALMKLRIHRLLETGDLIERNGRYFVGRRRLVLLGNFMTALKVFMLGKGSQFD